MSRRRILIGAAALVVLVLLGWGYQWWTHPDVFDRGNGYKVMQNADDLRPIHIAVTDISGDTEQRTIHIDDVEPNVQRNGTEAELELVLCTSKVDREPFVAVRNLEKVCELVRPAADADMRLGPVPGFDLLVLTITPTRPGVTKVDGVDVEYSLGPKRLWQHGSDTIGPEATLEVG